MKIATLVVGQLQTNCYLVWDKNNKQAVIIDPGDCADLIINKIIDFQLIPQYILSTHGHFDHVLAANELRLAFKIPLLVHLKDKNIIKKTSNSARFWLGKNMDFGPPPVVDKYLKKEMIIKFGKENLKVIESPGHSPGGVVFYSKRNKLLFSGDTFFKQGVGRTDLPYSSKEDLKKSIKKITRLPMETIVLPGHGEATMIKKEIPFLSFIDL